MNVMDKSNMKHVNGDNEGVMMHFKTITTNLLTMVQLLVEHITSLEESKDSTEEYISIRKIP